MTPVLNDEDKIELLQVFICDQGLWNSFVDFLDAKGYSEDDFDD
jgi:hypothetical protein